MQGFSLRLSTRLQSDLPALELPYSAALSGVSITMTTIIGIAFQITV